MTPIRTNLCNFTYTAPPGMEDSCGPLPCLRENGSTTSWWQPSADEQRAIAAGGTILFTAHTPGHPVVSISAVHPDGRPASAAPSPHPDEKNPEHPVTAAASDQWHKIAAILIAKQGIRSVSITPADIAAISAGDTNVVLRGNSHSLEVKLVSDDEARALMRTPDPEPPSADLPN